MIDILAGFDALGLGALVGSILFFAALVWVLVDNRRFDSLNQPRDGRSGDPEDHPHHPPAGRRAA